MRYDIIERPALTIISKLQDAKLAIEEAKTKLPQAIPVIEYWQDGCVIKTEKVGEEFHHRFIRKPNPNAITVTIKNAF